MHRLTDTDVDLAGQVVVVLGPHCPRGRATVEHLVTSNAHVVIAGGTIEQLAETRQGLLARIPHANISIMPIESSSPDAWVTAAQSILVVHPRVDLLINNSCTTPPDAHSSASVSPARDARGMRSFTVALLAGMEQAPDPRIVTVVTSMDLEVTSATTLVPVSTAQPLSVVDFIRELDRRLRRAGSRVRSVAANPTAAVTSTSRDMATTEPTGAVGRRLAAHLAQRAAAPILVAATIPSATGCTFSTPSTCPSADPVRQSLPPGSPGARRRWDQATCTSVDESPVLDGFVAA